MNILVLDTTKNPSVLKSNFDKIQNKSVKDAYEFLDIISGKTRQQRDSINERISISTYCIEAFCEAVNNGSLNLDNKWIAYYHIA